MYNFNAPYRGPRDSKEMQKLFASIGHDITVAYNELEEKNDILPKALEFCIVADIESPIDVDTAAIINSTSYSYKGTNELTKNINDISMRINHILEIL
jgi:hypothetical protein